MEKFSFEKWKNGAKVITGYGREVKHLTYFPDADKTKCLAGIVDNDILTWGIDGLYNYTKQYQLGNSWDLCHPEEQLYVNLYKSSTGLYLPGDVSYNLEAIKKYKAATGYFGTYKLVKI